MSVSLPRTTLALLAFLLVSLPTAAQQVLVQNGATVEAKNGGVWHLQGATMDFGGPGATATLNETAGGRVFGGSLTATRALNSPSSADPAGLGAELTAGADLGTVTITRGHTPQTAGGSASIERFYDIAPSKNNSGLDATLVHAYADAERNGIAESELTVFKSEDGGSTWQKEGYSSRDASANTVTLSGIASFSRWTLGSESDPLPVELTTFDGTRTKEGVQLRWHTASETGNAGFTVQRRVGSDSPSGHPATDWQRVGFVDGTGTTTDPQTYRYTDEALPYAADTLAYRLRQVDTDGHAEVTDPVTVAREAVQRLQLRQTFPNPARHRVTVQYAVPEGTRAEAVKLRLYDVLGRQVRTVEATAEAGRHERPLRVEGLSSGVYVLRLQTGTAARTQRITVVR